MSKIMSTANYTVKAIPAFSDNYIWAINSASNNDCALVDPGDADVCIQYIEQNQLTLTDIIITHHHNDHIGGIKKLLAYCDSKHWSINIVTPAKNDISPSTQTVDDNDIIKLRFLDDDIKVIGLPGHTLGHVAYLLNDSLFCGDTLFSAGCGRLFEGTPEQMYHSLAKLSALPDTTKVYCAHEYTQANLDFALTVEPSNIALINYYNQVINLRAQNMATIPTNIGLEKAVNPFIRAHSPEIKETVETLSGNLTNNEVDVFTQLRALKDNF